ncbi:ImmA/IrrE family metallo-endopeptidase [Virgibacillus sp. NKC19-3]|uniref:ImmA/IrrE family metallo-endopeptidase n=1 Tax=Virgibacillus saliphilus TaxID=2831674 RepID=UPI001C9B2A83|nr:ImmA/IrrE family metallo-endopeptidase [Virgibacillus sp. NKC19-3]MBY7144549.1 ImmA/IrrE family metallo-endopeptidase [Virgibacillus sp. NKC19-3]
MSVIRLKIEPKVILDAISKSGKDLEEVKNRFKNLHKWLNHELDPTFNQLNDLSRFLSVPLGYLLIKTPFKEDMPLLEFRTVDTAAIHNPSRELIDTIEDMERKQEWLRESFIEEGRDKLNFVGALNPDKDDNHLQIAAYIREVLNVEENWYEMANSKKSTYSLLREKLSTYGIIVMQSGIALNNTHRPLNINEFRAFTLVDEYVPLIFINIGDSNSGKTFSLLHELVHIFFGRNSLYNDDLKHRNKYTSPIETLYNKVASEIIAPTKRFINEWNKTYKDIEHEIEKITCVADHFKVSPLVIARKALDQGFINNEKYKEVENITQRNFEKMQKQTGSGGNSINNALSRLDKTFLVTLISSVESGKTLYTDAYRLAGVGRGVFEDLSERLKGVR